MSRHLEVIQAALDHLKIVPTEAYAVQNGCEYFTRHIGLTTHEMRRFVEWQIVHAFHMGADWQEAREDKPNGDMQ